MARHLSETKHGSKIIILLNNKDKTKTPPWIANKLHVSPQVVYDSLDGNLKKGSRRVRVYVARLLQKSPSELWAGVLTRQALLLDIDSFLHDTDEQLLVSKRKTKTKKGG